MSTINISTDGPFFAHANKEGSGLQKMMQQELIHIGILAPHDQLRSYTDTAYRHSGETYTTCIKLDTASHSWNIVGKCVCNRGRGVMMLKNRALLEKYQIPTTTLLGTRRNSEDEPIEFFEMHVDSTRSAGALDAGCEEARRKLQRSALVTLGRTGAVLDFLGFRVGNFARDMLIDHTGAHLYYADFGADLGEPSSDGQPTRMNHEFLKTYIRDDAQRRTILDAYQERLNELHGVTQ